MTLDNEMLLLEQISEVFVLQMLSRPVLFSLTKNVGLLSSCRVLPNAAAPSNFLLIRPWGVQRAFSITLCANAALKS